MPIFCPKCGKDDLIQKVSAIYSAGLSNGSYSGPTSGVAVPFGSGQPSIFGGFTTLNGTIQTSLSEKLSPPNEPKAPSLIKIIGLSYLFITIPACIVNSNYEYVFLFIIPIVAIVLMAKNYKRKKEAYLTAMERWTRGRRIWEKLYYCARDDCIFDPNSNLVIPAEQLQELY